MRSGRYARRLVRQVVLVLVSICSIAPLAHSCQCFPNASPCDSLGDSPVFLGTVTAINAVSYWDFMTMSEATGEQNPFVKDDVNSFGDLLKVEFSVEEAYSGSMGKSATVWIHRFVGACGFEYHPGGLFFQKGQKYLVYTVKSGEFLFTTHCSRTRRASDALQEIDMLRTIAKGVSPIVYGTYTMLGRDGAKIAAAAQTITLTGKHGRVFTQHASPDGHFIFSALPQDRYQVHITTPPKYSVDFQDGVVTILDDARVSWNPKSMLVSDFRCKYVSLYASPNGIIAGQVVDRSGKPLSGVSVNVWPADKVRVPGFGASIRGKVTTDENGRFKLKPLGQGEYVLGGFIAMPGDDPMNPSRWFYGGVSDPAKSKPIKLAFAQQLTNVGFVIPITIGKSRYHK